MTSSPPRRTLKDYALLFVKGFGMGSADVVPGVSGGTMALIFGVYEELIESLQMLSKAEFLHAMSRFRLGRALELLNWRFLLALVAGIAVAVLSLAQGLSWLLDNQPVYVWSFFFGLVAASVWSVSQRVRRWRVAQGVALVMGGVGAFWLVGLTPTETPRSFLFFLLSGAVAICAMVLPGISGAFILLLLGKYEQVLGAVTQGDLVTVGAVALGALLGLLSFSRLLGWLLAHHHDTTLAALGGFLVGSLRKIWPWQRTTEGELSVNVLPNWLVQEGLNPEIIGAALLALVGFALVLLIDQRGGARQG